ncbi:MAG: hypothetical protein HC852_08135 [Acaryochloridaceae cyanobacterium RU_4_10]|jgi:hypothetical protein|nr:hypothetical protein [Acaryochloridaceae cyanobacterium RU_4_10]
MTQSSITVTYSLEEVLARIEGKIDDLGKELNEVRQKDLADLRVGQARLEEKVDGLAKRIDNQEFISRGVLIGLIVAIAGGAAKLFGFMGNS